VVNFTANVQPIGERRKMKIYKFDKLVKEAINSNPEFHGKEVWVDSKGAIAYVKGVPPRIHGGMSKYEFDEGKDMQQGSIVRTYPDGSKKTFYPPFKKLEQKTVYQKLQDEDKIPMYFDYDWDDTINGIPVSIFSNIADDTETMGGIGVDTKHALGYDKNGNFFHWKKDTYSDGEETYWYDA
jgi:hypothetical protein